jgi:hypothetical protein
MVSPVLVAMTTWFYTEGSVCHSVLEVISPQMDIVMHVTPAVGCVQGQAKQTVCPVLKVPSSARKEDVECLV